MENYIYKTISTKAEIDKLIGYCKTSGWASLDFETNGTYLQKPWWMITTLGVSFQPGSAWVIHLGHKDSPNKHRWKSLVRYFLEGIFKHKHIRIVVFNASFEHRIFKYLLVKPQGPVLDVMLMKYLLDEERPHDLKSIVDRLLPDFSGYDVVGKPSSKAAAERHREFWENVDLEELSKYNALDADLTLRLAIYLEQRLIDVGLYRLFRSMYMALMEVLTTTILKGVKVDRPYLESLEEKYSEILAEINHRLRNIPEFLEYEDYMVEERVDAYVEILQDEIDNGGLSVRQIEHRENKIESIQAYEATTKKEEKLLEPLNLGSPKQLSGLLYDDNGLGFPITKYTHKGAPSTNEDAMLELLPDDDTAIISTILEIRAVGKVYTTYVKNLLADQVWDGYIHPGYLLHGTTTSRLSSRGPNFQNIPRVTSDPFVKGMFFASPGYYFIESDFCIPEDSWVYSEEGVKKMGKLALTDKATVLGNNHSITEIRDNGIKQTLITTTSMGRELDTTPNHRIKTTEGYKRHDELMPGDILMNDTSIIPEGVRMDPNEAYIAGLFYGDGYYSQNLSKDRRKTYKVGFSTGLDRKELIPILQNFFHKHITIPTKANQGVSIYGKDLHKAWSERYPKNSSHSMRIPEHIMGSDFESRMHFLGGAIDSDGSVYSNRIRYTSVCKEYIQDLLVLANSVGIYGIISYTEKTKAHHLLIYDAEHLKKVYPYLRLTRKREALKHFAHNKSFSQCRTNYIPLSVCKRAIDSSKQIYKHIKNAKRKQRLTRFIIKDRIIPLQSPAVQQMWWDILDYRYEEVRHTRPGRLVRTVDITVKDNHTFVVNGLSVHNSQAELRMVAIMAQDEAMILTFKEGKNIHVNTAVLMFNEDYSVLNKARKDDSHPLHIEMVKKHKTAKVLNFAILYGMGAKNLAIRLSVATGENYTEGDAEDFIAKWFEAFPQVKTWMKKVEKRAMNKGYTINPFGFKRRLPIFDDPDNKRFAKGLWNAALRVSVNAPIQGGASMLTQLVNIEVYRKVLQGKMPSYLRLVSTVHDSIEFYVKKEDIDWYVAELNEIIDRVPELAMRYYGADLSGVYFKMSTEIGVRWNQMHEYDKDKDYEAEYPVALDTFNTFCEEHGLDNNQL